nr:contactin-6-like [Odocoileus virginianus texanus]
MRLLWKLVILMSLINISAGDGGLSPPIFTQEPEDAIFPLDLSKAEIILNCAANGYPSPHYRWKQNGADIDFTMSYHYRLDGGSLAISSPRTDQDIGTYQCLATNSLGTILSQKAKLQFASLATGNSQLTPMSPEQTSINKSSAQPIDFILKPLGIKTTQGRSTLHFLGPSCYPGFLEPSRHPRILIGG